ncbi:unnamed protein product [Urochloa humidicola]
MSIRTRWHFYLAPGIKRGAITAEEEEDIIRLHGIHGNNWFDIAWKLPGRTSKDVRDHWREHLSQRLIAQGIDPRTHKPLPVAETSSSQSQQSTDDDMMVTGRWCRCYLLMNHARRPPFPEPEKRTVEATNGLCNADASL